MKREDGFTAIELIIFFVVMIVLAAFFIMQKLDLDASYTDQNRKTAVNAVYYSLTDVYYPEHGFYPSQIAVDSLKAIDPELLVDPWGIEIDSPNSDYQYEGLDCDQQGQCQRFKLSADLDKEDDYILESQ